MRRLMVLFCALSGLLFGPVGDGVGQEIHLDKAPLGVGDKAPKLVVQFIKGDPVTHFEKGKVYVVELATTGCPGCIASVPHLTRLQKKYPDVVIIGVMVWGDANASRVRSYVKKMGKDLGYRLAVDRVPAGEDPQNGIMSQTWMRPANQNGIPAAFIVDGDGRIAWIGYPWEMDVALEKVRSGRWDLQAAAAKLNQPKHEAEQRLFARLPEVERTAVQAIRNLVGGVILGVSNNSVIAISFKNPTEVTDARLKELQKLKKLSELNLNSSKVTDVGLKELQGLKRLQLLSIDGTRVTDAGLKELKQLKELRTLYLQRTRVTGTGLQELKGVQVLILNDAPVTDAGLQGLQELKELGTLYLNGTRVMDPGLKELAKLKGLRNVELNNTGITDAGLRELRGLKRLQSLGLSYTQVTDAGLKELQGLQRLQCLSLDGTRVTDAGLKELKQLPELDGLYLDDTRVTDVGLKELSRKLRILFLCDTQITDVGLKELKGMKDLNFLKLEGTQVTDAGLQELKQMGIFRKLDLLRTKVTEAGAADLQKALPTSEIVR